VATKEDRYDSLYLDLAKRIALMSHAEKRKVGAIAVKNNNILSFGFNGTPTGFPNKCEDDNNKTLSYVIHAEANLVSKAAAEGLSLRDSTVYVTTAPCDNCALLLIQSGIKRVVFSSSYKTDSGILTLIHSNIRVQQK
jgi:dCMP deaminase